MTPKACQKNRVLTSFILRFGLKALFAAIGLCLFLSCICAAVEPVIFLSESQWNQTLAICSTELATIFGFGVASYSILSGALEKRISEDDTLESAIREISSWARKGILLDALLVLAGYVACLAALALMAHGVAGRFVFSLSISLSILHAVWITGLMAVMLDPEVVKVYSSMTTAKERRNIPCSKDDGAQYYMEYMKEFSEMEKLAEGLVRKRTVGGGGSDVGYPMSFWQSIRALGEQGLVAGDDRALLDRVRRKRNILVHSGDTFVSPGDLNDLRMARKKLEAIDANAER